MASSLYPRYHDDDILTTGGIAGTGIANLGITLTPGEAYEVTFAQSASPSVGWEVYLPHTATNGIHWCFMRSPFRFVASSTQTTMGVLNPFGSISGFLTVRKVAGMSDLKRSGEFIRFDESETTPHALATVGNDYDTTIIPGASYMVSGSQEANQIEIKLGAAATIGSATILHTMLGSEPFRFTAMQGQDTIRLTPQTSIDNLSVTRVYQ